ncbi:MAG: S1C family serine protease [Actinomycetota bacterium]|nr:S1C family serine protease [Actinomycetota bacterium]
MQDYSGYSMPPTGGGGYGGPTSPLPQGPPPPPPPPPPRRRIGLLSYLGVALAAGALGAGTVVAIYHPTASSSALPPSSSSAIPAVPVPPPSSAVPLPSSGPGTSPAESAAVRKVAPGLVIINTTLQYSSEAAAGTGMVLNSTGLVLTNNHVIENATKISATVLSTGRTYPAKVVGYDVTGDVAEIQLQGASGLHTIPVGDSSTVKVGASVVALGNAEGQSQIIAAPGQIKALNQSIVASDQGGTVSSENLHGMFETNANIVAGDSGGPLADAAGQVIGMDTAGNGGGFSPQQSTSGFAIPIATALSVARQISAGQASSTVAIGYPPFIGIYIGKGQTTSPQAQAAQQQSQGGFGGAGNGPGSGGNASCYTSDANLTAPASIAPVSSGALVLGAICDSPASAAGLTAGSVITAVNGQTVGSPHSLTSIMSKFRPGTHVSLTWVTPSSQDKTGTLILTAGPPL